MNGMLLSEIYCNISYAD